MNQRFNYQKKSKPIFLLATIKKKGRRQIRQRPQPFARNQRLLFYVFQFVRHFHLARFFQFPDTFQRKKYVFFFYSDARSMTPYVKIVEELKRNEMSKFDDLQSKLPSKSAEDK